MKKIINLKLMLLGLLAFGSNYAFAQDAPAQNAELTVGRYVYTVTKQSVKKQNGDITTGTVEMTRVAQGQTTVDGNNLVFPGAIEYPMGGTTYQYDVTTMNPDVFRDNSYAARHAVIPAQLTEIPTGAFNTLTNLFDLTFETGSKVTKIGPQAFASTQISSFDFSPCTKLEGLQDGVFVEAPHNEGDVNVNANITNITLPTSTAFKHINGAFRNLTNLTTITNLENSWIRELIDGAFDGCEKLWQLTLPGNDLQYISRNALAGSVIADLTVNVGNGATNGNPMQLLGGCTVAYVFDEETQSYVYNYEPNYATAVANANAYNQAKVTTYNTAANQYNEANGFQEGQEGYRPLLPNPVEIPVTALGDNTASTTNLYGFNENKVDNVRPIAPLRKLTIAGTLQGKICTNAFAWCDYLADATKGTFNVGKGTNEIEVTLTPAFIVDDLLFGSKGQIKTHAFYKDIKIASLTLNDINDNKLEEEQYTIEANAFEGCPIATLTLGNIMTNNAIGSQAFGNNLKNVTIGTVKATASAFQAANGDVKGAFVWDNVSGATLSLATGENEYVSSDIPNNNNKIIPAGVFDFSAVKGGKQGEPATYIWPVVEIGEILSQGGVFAEGTIIGKNVEKIHFTGDINTNGLDVAILVPELQQTPVFETQDKAYAQADLPATASIKLATDPKLKKGDFVKIGDVYYKVNKVAEPIEYEQELKLYDQVDNQEDILAADADPVAGKYVAEGEKYKKIAEVTDQYNYRLKELTFTGAIKSTGIGTGAFINFTNLTTLTFSGLLSKEAVASGAFANTGLVQKGGAFEGFITAENAKDNVDDTENPELPYGTFVKYTANLSANDASENPFATDAFVSADEVAAAQPGAAQAEPIERIIYWYVADENLRNSILCAIQKDVMDNDGNAETIYDGEVVNPKFNVYKWVAYIVPEKPTTPGFIVFTDNTEIPLDQETDETMAWGRYDLGSFAEEGDVADQDLDAVDMIIPRYQTVKGVGSTHTYKAKVTLYGMYWDQDDNGEKSNVYMVPLQVINGNYYIRRDNTHLIIAKVQNLDETNTTFAEDQIFVNYVDAAAELNPNAQIVESVLENAQNSVWKQLQDETAGQGPVLDADEGVVKRIFAKADHSWTNQELVDAVTNEGGQQNTAEKDLHVLLDPSVNAGFDVKRLIIERKTDGTGAYIGKNWYYALLKNYGQPSNQARIIWLDYDQATAIFGVQAINTNASDGNNGIFNLQGIRVNKATKGVYIQNGKKIVVK